MIGIQRENRKSTSYVYKGVSEIQQRENRKGTSYVYKGVSEIKLKTANINQDEYAGFRNRGPENCCLINKQFQTHGFIDENFLGCSKVL